jgi:solute carrier family 25 (adenine nucleotide translocator) protein 4/5/6/31
MIFNGIITKQYDGIIDCFKKTKNIEGSKALWKGNSITLLRYYPNELMNNSVKNVVQTWLPSSVLSKVISGICGGWVAAGILYPFDMIRIFISTSVTSQKESVKNFCAKIGK